MLSSHVATLGGTLYRRASEFPEPGGDGSMGQLPGWAVIVFFADFLFFFPMFIYVSYVSQLRVALPPPPYSQTRFSSAVRRHAALQSPPPSWVMRLEQQDANSQIAFL